MRALAARAALMVIACALAAPAARAQGAGPTFILGDTSGSMKGYVKGGASRLAALYQLLYRNAEAPRLAALTSDRAGAARIAEVAQSAHFGLPGTYRGETDLVLALQEVQRRGGTGVLVTDGMPSGGTYLRVKEEMLRMVRGGWGVWLTSVRLPFDGTIDPEQMLDLDAIHEHITRCAREDDPRSEVTYARGANRFYNFAGQRPLLIFVLTRDPAAGRELTLRLDANLKADPQYSSQTAELSPLFYRGLAFAPAQTVSDYVRLDDGAEALAIRSDTVDGNRTKEVFLPVLWRAGEPPVAQPFKEVPVFPPPEVVSWVEEEVVAVADESDPQGLRTPGRIRVPFVSEKPWYRGLCFLPIISCDDVKSEALNLVLWTEFKESEPQWWNALNADNSYQCPTRVYKLAELARDLAQAAKERIKPEEQKTTKAVTLVVGQV